MFLVGAGCSASAGIPLASRVAETAVIGLAQTYGVLSGVAEPTPQAALEALISSEKFPSRFGIEDGLAPWGEIYSYIFSEHIKHPNDQRALITRLVETKDFELNWSHACLGELVHKRFVHTVLTTNFDQLVLKGIIRTGIIPVVADGLESLTRISATPRWPQVVHLHGSMHTYELRNSYVALQETGQHRGLQALMLSILKETTALVIIGYSGSEEGIMSLLQDAATSLPRMVVYWIAFESDYALLSERARAFLEVGEHKFFVLNQEADDFFNRLIGELGIGPPSWIKNPLEVLSEQVKIKYSATTSDDVARLINSYEDRVAFAVGHGRMGDTPEIEATELRSANKFREAAERIAIDPGYQERNEALRIHATSLYDRFNKQGDSDEAVIRLAIEQFEKLVSRGDRVVRDTEILIEARRDLFERLQDGDASRFTLAQSIVDSSKAAQAAAPAESREWAVMEFYQAEGNQLLSEHLKHSTDGEEQGRQARRVNLLELSRAGYSSALPFLAKKDSERARECKEGLAGALSGLAELESQNSKALSHLREAKSLFQEVVDTARRNTPGRQYAGALENLAGVVEITATRYPEEAHNARNEERELLQIARGIYIDIEDEDSAQRMQLRIDRFRDEA